VSQNEIPQLGLKAYFWIRKSILESKKKKEETFFFKYFKVVSHYVGTCLSVANIFFSLLVRDLI